MHGNRPVFVTGPGAERPPVGVLALHAAEGREAAWMAAGAAAVRGHGVVVAHAEWDLIEASHTANRARVSILIARDFEEASSMLGATPRLQDYTATEPPEPDWLAELLTSSLPAGGALFVEEAVPDDGGPLFSALVPGARGHAVAAAIGAKAAAPDRAVLALVDEDSFAIGSSALAVASRHGLGVGVVVRAEHPDSRCDLVAEARGAHGEMIEDPATLRLHLHNALASPLPSVLTLGLDRRRSAARLG